MLKHHERPVDEDPLVNKAVQLGMNRDFCKGLPKDVLKDLIKNNDLYKANTGKDLLDIEDEMIPSLARHCSDQGEVDLRQYEHIYHV